jgi:toxin ParE1/3/4
MPTKHLEIHPAALAELESAAKWYQKRNQTAAVNFVGEVDRVLDLVLSSPGRWPRGEHGSRQFVLRRFPYAVIYREKRVQYKFLRSLTDIANLITGKDE